MNERVVLDENRNWAPFNHPALLMAVNHEAGSVFIIRFAVVVTLLVEDSNNGGVHKGGNDDDEITVGNKNRVSLAVMPY